MGKQRKKPTKAELEARVTELETQNKTQHELFLTTSKKWDEAQKKDREETEAFRDRTIVTLRLLCAAEIEIVAQRMATGELKPDEGLERIKNTREAFEDGTGALYPEKRPGWLVSALMGGLAAAFLAPVIASAYKGSK